MNGYEKMKREHMISNRWEKSRSVNDITGLQKTDWPFRKNVDF